MLNAELSNIWGSISLPALLQQEKTIFDAHLRLRSNEPDEIAPFAWLGAPDAVTAKNLHAVRTLADQIRTSCDLLVVVGGGTAFLAAKAAVRFLSAQNPPQKPETVFFSGDLSSAAWRGLCAKMEGREVCLLLIMPNGTQTEAAVASRGMRWLLERRYGSQSKKRVFTVSLPDSPIAQMAHEGGFAFLPLPTEPFGDRSSLTNAVLLPVCAAGFDPLGILEGACEAYRQMDLRAFENPAWMYTGARYCLKKSGKAAELLCAFDPSLSALCAWWKELFLRTTVRGQKGLIPMTALLPAELDALDAAFSADASPIFMNHLRICAQNSRRVGVEMDWKDYDGLGNLSGKMLEDVEQAEYETACEVFSERGAAMLSLELDGADEYHLGELFYFFELCALLSAQADEIAPEKGELREAIMQTLGRA